jgi:hypothetical protein
MSGEPRKSPEPLPALLAADPPFLGSLLAFATLVMPSLEQAPLSRRDDIQL